MVCDSGKLLSGTMDLWDVITTLWDMTVGCDWGTVRIGIVLGAVKLDPEALDHKAQGGMPDEAIGSC